MRYRPEDDEAAPEHVLRGNGSPAPRILRAGRVVTEREILVRAEFLDWGILVRLRYQTIPAQRQEISTAIIEILLREFSRHYPRVRFANPATTIRYRPDDPEKDQELTGDIAADTDRPGPQRPGSNPA